MLLALVGSARDALVTDDVGSGGCDAVRLGTFDHVSQRYRRIQGLAPGRSSPPRVVTLYMAMPVDGDVATFKRISMTEPNRAWTRTPSHGGAMRGERV